MRLAECRLLLQTVRQSVASRRHRDQGLRKWFVRVPNLLRDSTASRTSSRSSPGGAGNQPHGELLRMREQVPRRLLPVHEVRGFAGGAAAAPRRGTIRQRCPPRRATWARPSRAADSRCSRTRGARRRCSPGDPRAPDRRTANRPRCAPPIPPDTARRAACTGSAGRGRGRQRRDIGGHQLGDELLFRSPQPTSTITWSRRWQSVRRRTTHSKSGLPPSRRATLPLARVQSRSGLHDAQGV